MAMMEDDRNDIDNGGAVSIFGVTKPTSVNIMESFGANNQKVQ